MKTKLLIIIFLFLLSGFFSPTYAQKADLKASVGKYYFSASGIVSPYTSVVMTSQTYFLSSTVADSNGKFILPRAIVNDGFSGFCLEATDFKRIGTSYTCFKVESPHADISKDSIFLPPTVGLSAKQVKPNSSIISSGYSMPESDVTVNVGEGISIKTKADKQGYYKATIKDLPKGTYELYAAAVYEGKGSGKPTRTLKIEVLGMLSLVPTWLLILASVLLLVLIIIPIIILWKMKRKKKPQKKANSRRKFFFWRA